MLYHYRNNTFPQQWLVASLLLMPSVHASTDGFQHSNNSSIQLSRYSIQLTDATKAQKDPLQAVIKQVRFPSKVKTVGVAINTVLKNSGYRIKAQHLEPKVKDLFRFPLPAIQRNMGPLTVEQALTTLAGEPWILVVDREHRLISFQLSETSIVKPVTDTATKPTNIDELLPSLNWDEE